MKRSWLLLVFYCIIHQTSGDIATTYEGMDQAAVIKLVQQTYAVPFDFVDQATYKAFVSAHTPKVPGRPAAMN